MQIPSKERVAKISEILHDPSNKFDFRLKTIGLDIESMAHIIAMAEFYVSLLNKFQTEKKAAKNGLENAKDRLKRKIGRIESANKAKFSDLPTEIRLSSLYKRDGDGNENIRVMSAASRDFDFVNTKIKRMFGSESKPKEKAMDLLCKDIRDLYKQSGLELKNNGHKLIADLANFFLLSKQQHQTLQTIAKRISRL